MTTPNGFTRQDAERVALFVKQREARRARPGFTKREPAKLPGLRMMVCTSEPNVEAIDNLGTWPQTINAKVVKKSDGYALDAIGGRCIEGDPGGGGGGGPTGCSCNERLPCSKNSQVKFVWGDNAVSFGATEGDVAAVLSYVRSEFVGGCEQWIYESEDGEWTATLGIKFHGGFVACGPDCYGLAGVTWSNPPPGSPFAFWLMVPFLGDLVTGGRCQYLCSQGVVFDTSDVIGQSRSILTMYWEGGIPGASIARQDVTTGEEDTDHEDDGDLVVQLHRFMNGVPFYGEVFLAANYGGRFYAFGPHHSGIAGSLTDRVRPRTVLMDRCDYEVPFIYTIPDPKAPEGTRHLLAWVAAKKKYVMIAMGGCQ